MDIQGNTSHFNQYGKFYSKCISWIEQSISFQNKITDKYVLSFIVYIRVKEIHMEDQSI